MNDVPQLIPFLNSCPSPFHTVDTLEDIFQKNGFQTWDSTPIQAGQKILLRHYLGSLVLIRIPQNIPAETPFKVYAAHTDSPCLKIKSEALDNDSPGLLSVETYGGGIWDTWTGINLRACGAVKGINAADQMEQISVELSPRFHSPRLAIHLDRKVNDSLSINPQSQLQVLSDIAHKDAFLEELKQQSQLKEIYAWDLGLYADSPAQFLSAQKELICAPRLDDMAMVHALSQAFLQDLPSDSIEVLLLLNHEEVGSSTLSGGASRWITQIFESLKNQLKLDPIASMNSSLIISADMAHARHPGYPEKMDPLHSPEFGLGPVLKTSAKMRYATDLKSAAYIRKICSDNQIALQEYHNRNDIPSGSTLGPILSSQLGISAVDLGNAMLSMHCSQETIHYRDHLQIMDLFEKIRTSPFL